MSNKVTEKVLNLQLLTRASPKRKIKSVAEKFSFA